MNTKITRLVTSLITLAVCSIPTVAAAEAVQGIELTAAPNAIGIRWQKPTGIEVGHFKVYFSKASILENNGRFLGAEETIGPQTSLALLDLVNRGFQEGETIYVTVTVVGTDGQERTVFAEEQSTTVELKARTHAAAGLALQNAVATDETTVNLSFSAPVGTPEGHPAMHVGIADDEGNSIPVLSLEVADSTVTLRTAPMEARGRYTVTVAESIKAADGTALDSAKNTASFIARTQPSSPPSTSETAVPPDTTPPEDASNLRLTRELQSDGRYTVHARWDASANSASDLARYNLYESANRGTTYAGPTALLGTILTTSIANIPPGTFTLKVTAQDQTGNESAGIVEMIILPETGAAMTLLLSSVGAGLYALRRSRRSPRARN